MSVLNRLKEYLDGKKVGYQVLTHGTTYNAKELAQALHIAGKDLAKVVMLKAGERFVMAVLPATWKVDLHRFRDLFQTHEVRLATEDELRGLFPDCELGAMPPFGNLYGLEVYADQSLAEDEEIVFSAGTYSEAVKLRYRDFADLVKPKVAEFHMPSPWPKTGS
jgi:Ala-tRNA(Pro) deacylase